MGLDQDGIGIGRGGIGSGPVGIGQDRPGSIRMGLDWLGTWIGWVRIGTE